jgi:hypothetical protein
MSTKKTTTTAPAKKTPAAKKPAPVKAPAKEATKKPATKAKAPAKPAQTPLDALLAKYPASPKEITAEQLKALQLEYLPLKPTLTTEEVGRVRTYAMAATANLKKVATAGPEADQTEAASEEEIDNLVGEMNEVMDLEPIIAVRAGDTMEQIKAEARDLRESDFDSTKEKFFTIQARATFRKLGIALPGEKAAKAKAPKVPGKKGGTPRTRDGAPCSKTVVYLAWKKGQTDVDKLMSLPGQNAALITVRGWLSAWKNGKNLPAVAAQTGK